MSRRVQLEASTAGELHRKEPEKAATAVAPDQLTPEAVLALQSQAGNAVVQRLLARSPKPAAPVQTGPVLPYIGGQTAIVQLLLEGVMQKNTIDEAVRQIYDNMFQKTGWTYRASDLEKKGTAFLDGNKTAGMCEGYRNAFKEVLLIYDRLRASHPTDAIKNGTLMIADGDDLAPEKFITRKGLTLMGATALKGNVYRVVDAGGNVLEKGIDSIGRFVFTGHWTLKVNGKEYDPIFHSIDQDNVATILGPGYSEGTGRYVGIQSKPTPANEFGATYIFVTDWAPFQAVIDDCEEFYADNAAEIDAIADASLWKQAKRAFKPDELTKDARKIFKGIDNRKLLDEMVESLYLPGHVTRAQKKAYDAVAAIA